MKKISAGITETVWDCGPLENKNSKKKCDLLDKDCGCGSVWWLDYCLVYINTLHGSMISLANQHGAGKTC